MNPDPSENAVVATPRKRWGKPATAGLALLTIILAVHFLPIFEWWPLVMNYIHDLGPIGYALFILLHIVATVCLVPALLLGIGAGFVYGIWTGFALLSVAATLGAITSFLITRFLARDFVAERIAQYPKYAAIDNAVGREGWKIVFLTRLSPGFPFNILNYFFGLTKVPLGTFIWASYVGMLPRFIVYVYAGSIAGNLSIAAAAPPLARIVFPILGIALTIIVTVYVAHLIRRALEEETTEDIVLGDDGLELLEPIQPAEAID